jgi:hypothetical protein
VRRLHLAWLLGQRLPQPVGGVVFKPGEGGHMATGRGRKVGHRGRATGGAPSCLRPLPSVTTSGGTGSRNVAAVEGHWATHAVS